MYYNALNKTMFILIALTVPINYIIFRIKPNLLHFKVLENKIIKIIAIIPIFISLLIFILKLIEETYFLPNMFLDMFYPSLGPNYFSILMVLTMWSTFKINSLISFSSWIEQKRLTHGNRDRALILNY